MKAEGDGFGDRDAAVELVDIADGGRGVRCFLLHGDTPFMELPEPLSGGRRQTRKGKSDLHLPLFRL